MANIEQFDRELTLKRVTEIFQKKGYNGTSMQDLVEITGLNRSSIYNSFGSKLALYFSALDFYKSQFKKNTISLNNSQLNGLEKIQHLFCFYVTDILNDTEGKGCMIMNCKSEMAASNKEIVKWIKQNAQDTLVLLEAMLNEGQIQGVINKKQNPKKYALYLMSSLEGLRTTGILNKNRLELESIVNTIISTIN